jgi:beta-galactosidase
VKLGVCYYPEQWPESWWTDDARRMREMGISHVRLAEFSWGKIEPVLDQFDWGWLDRAIDTLVKEGLSIILCTPTATPPKWLVDSEPSILADDANGHQRRFGSRRHYCFSSPIYRQHSARITRHIAERYGKHAAVVAWQTDNEYGCHETVLSYSNAARLAFRQWLIARYQQIDDLNAAWGTTFWSQQYRHFDEIDPPAATVTEANPSHRLDWQRFASDEVVAFNREQVAILRELSPGRPITHNFMGFFTSFNHHDVAKELDIAAWDSYPLGFTQMFFLDAEEKIRWAFVGHPDIPSFHHDLYRGMCRSMSAAKNRGRWWVMEQQPGPVNWANWNPAPRDGMVRLWTWQAFAHGAELVSYFRWRQAPFAQEQMHAGLLRPDRHDDQGAVEVARVNIELKKLRDILPIDDLVVSANVALVFDYDALWMTQIQPQGADFNGLELCFRLYSALRQLGLDVDIVSPQANLSEYRLILLPALPHIAAPLLAALQASTAQIVMAPRTGSKTLEMHIPANLAPGVVTELAGLSVTRVASLPPGITLNIDFDGTTITATRWRESVTLNGAISEAAFADGATAISRHHHVRYVAAWLSNEGWLAVLYRAATDAGLIVSPLPASLRISRIGTLAIACNFGDVPVLWQPDYAADCLVGAEMIAPQDVAIWQSRPCAQ